MGWFKLDPSNLKTAVHFFHLPKKPCRSQHMPQNTFSIEFSICISHLACYTVPNTKKQDGRCIVRVLTKHGGSIVGGWYNVLKVHHLAGLQYLGTEAM